MCGRVGDAMIVDRIDQPDAHQLLPNSVAPIRRDGTATRAANPTCQLRPRIDLRRDWFSCRQARNCRFPRSGMDVAEARLPLHAITTANSSEQSGNSVIVVLGPLI